MKTRILLADDHAILRDGLKTALELEEVFEIIGEATDGVEAIDLSLKLSPDIVLMDISMPLIDGLTAAKRIKMFNGNIKIIILTMFDNKQFVNEALSSGVEGYLLKMTKLDDVIKAINAVLDGDNYYDPAITHTLLTPETGSKGKGVDHLSDREKEIMNLIIQGYTSAEISEKLYISPHTVNNHRKNILSKLGLKNSAELLRQAINGNL